jgi:Protein of unknown function (DUF1573)
MKYLFLISIAAIIVSCTSTDKPSTHEEAAKDSLNRIAMADSSNYTTLQWLDSTTQNLGKIKEGSVVEITWKFKNTGDKPLIVANANGTCGCTIADRPKEPVAPGQEGVIKARFNSQGQGPEAHKTVSVDANTKPETHHSLTFTAQITKE